MAYREDKDLDFLGEMSNEELNTLVNIITKDEDGSTRWTEELTSNDLYKRHYPNHAKYWHLIAAEIQCFGANTFVTLFRGGKGVLYREVLTDAAEHINAKFDERDSTRSIENAVIEKTLESSLEKMSLEERQAFIKATGLRNVRSLSLDALMSAIHADLQTGGIEALTLTAAISNAASRAYQENSVGVKSVFLMLAGPLGPSLPIAFGGPLAALSGPAYRVTLPAVIQVSLLRKIHQFKKAGTTDKLMIELEQRGTSNCREQ